MGEEKPCSRFSTSAAGSSTPATGLGTLHVTRDLTAARQLRDAHRGVGGKTLFGTVPRMPEEELSRGIEDPHDRLMFLTCTVSIDYQRDAEALWRHTRSRYDDLTTRWLFCPKEVAAKSPVEVLEALRRGNPHGALRYPAKDASWWHHNASSFAQYFDGSPRVLFERSAWDVLRIRREINRSGRFLGLRGAKIFPLWIRMLTDVLGYQFQNYSALPIPVDIHIARASFTTGLVRGKYEGPFGEELIALLRRAWTEACVATGESHMSFDEPLWQLSRLGCTHRHEGGSPDCPRRMVCPIGGLCPRGWVSVSTEGVRVET